MDPLCVPYPRSPRVEAKRWVPEVGAGGGLPSEGLALPLSQVEGPPDESADAILCWPRPRPLKEEDWGSPRWSGRTPSACQPKVPTC